MTSTEFFFDRSIEVYELDGKIFSLGISKFFQPLFECCPQWSRAGLNRRDTHPRHLARCLRAGQLAPKSAAL
jgi:hypothetical protein